MATHVALLRGINVGGARKLPMADLSALLAGLGLEDVRTYIASGNVLFTAPRAGRQLATRIERAIEEATGLDVAVLLRTPAALAEVVERNPFPDGNEGSLEAPRRLPRPQAGEGGSGAPRPGPLAARRAEPARRRGLPALPERLREDEAHARLLRADARRARHRAELEHGAEAARPLPPLRRWRRHEPAERRGESDGPSRARTGDLLAASQTLSQLSYGPAVTRSV